jgi:outer membrane protein assembly factor BamB
VNADHEDLTGRVLFGGLDWCNEVVEGNQCETDLSPDDEHGHGTHTASIAAAAANNGTGMAGVAFNAGIWAEKVFGFSSTYTYSSGCPQKKEFETNLVTSDHIIAQAIRHAVLRGARVINLSLGSASPEGQEVLKAGVDYALAQRRVVVAAAGNDNCPSSHYPAALDGVISVGATDEEDRRSVWNSGASNYGARVDLYAPGTNIVVLKHDDNTGWKNKFGGGTSAAAPFVAGVASLMLFGNRDLTPAEVRGLLTCSADIVGTDPNGNPMRRLNAEEAVRLAAQGLKTCPNQLPLGAFDEISDAVISGWSYDPDHTESSNTIQIFFDGPAGQGGTLIHSGPTDVFRPDVNSAHGIAGTHGFEFTIRADYRDGQPHEVFIYGIDLDDSSKSTLLTGSPMSFTLGAALQPNLMISTATCPIGMSCSGPPGTTFTIEGEGFTPGGNVRRFVKEPSGLLRELTPLVSADSNGMITWSFTTNCGTPTGAFLISARDEATDQPSNTVTEIHLAGDCTVSLFFDGSVSYPDLFPPDTFAAIGEPVIDSQGRLIAVSSYSNSFCGGNFCTPIRLNSILPSGTLNWQGTQGIPNSGPYISTDIFPLRRHLAIGLEDRIYVQAARDTLLAYDSDGVLQPGWPVTITSADGTSGRLFTSGTLTNQETGLAFVTVSPFVAFDNRPSVTVALETGGVTRWHKEGVDAGSFLQGPGDDIYVFRSDRMIRFNIETGVQQCEGPVPLSHAVIGDETGLFGSFRPDITEFDGACGNRIIFSSTIAVEVVLHSLNEQAILATEYLGSLNQPFDPLKQQVLAVSHDGTLLWRNSRIAPNTVGGANPVRAIGVGTVYITGQDKEDGGKVKLFVVDASSGIAINAIETSPLCGSCGVAVAKDGTIYINDLNSTKIYKVR